MILSLNIITEWVIPRVRDLRSLGVLLAACRAERGLMSRSRARQCLQDWLSRNTDLVWGVKNFRAIGMNTDFETLNSVYGNQKHFSTSPASQRVLIEALSAASCTCDALAYSSVMHMGAPVDHDVLLYSMNAHLSCTISMDDLRFYSHPEIFRAYIETANAKGRDVRQDMNTLVDMCCGCKDNEVSQKYVETLLDAARFAFLTILYDSERGWRNWLAQVVAERAMTRRCSILLDICYTRYVVRAHEDTLRMVLNECINSCSAVLLQWEAIKNVNTNSLFLIRYLDIESRSGLLMKDSTLREIIQTQMQTLTAAGYHHEKHKLAKTLLEFREKHFLLADGHDAFQEAAQRQLVIYSQYIHAQKPEKLFGLVFRLCCIVFAVVMLLRTFFCVSYTRVR